MKRLILVASVVLTAPLAAGAQATSRSPNDVYIAPVIGVHFGEWQYASATLGVRAIRRRWHEGEPGIEPGWAAIAAVEPGIAGARAGLGFGWVGLEEGANKDSRFAIQVIGAQLGPSVLQTWIRTHAADHPTTYAGLDARVTFIAGVAGGLYWRVAGKDGSRRRIAVVSFGFSY